MNLATVSMFPLIFQISQLPDLKSSKYTALYGQNVRQKVLNNQKDFLLLLSELGKVYSFTFSIRYSYFPDDDFDQRLRIYLSISQSANSRSSSYSDIKQIFEQGFLQQFYQLKHQEAQLQDLNWVSCIGEAIKYEEIISNRPKDSLASFSTKGLPSYYVPLQFEADEANDMLVVCQTISSFNQRLVLEITLQPDTTSLQEKSHWINALDQMLSQLRQASSGSGLGSSKEGDRNAQLVSRLYEKYQSSYLTENLYRYSLKVLGENELAVRSVLGTLMLSGTKKSRHRTIILDSKQSTFRQSLEATRLGQLSTVAQWEAWDQGLGNAEFGGDSFSGKGSVRVENLKPLHRLATLSEIGGLFRIVVPGGVPVQGISQENDVLSLKPDQSWLDVGGYEIARPECQVQIALKQLNKHAFICGVPGSGKTTTAFNLLTQLWGQKIPFLVFEPAKTEYRSLLAIEPKSEQFSLDQLQRLSTLPEELRVYTLGNDSISPFRFNPFEVSEGVPFFEHIANLEASFRGSLSLSGPLPALLSEALEEIYYDQSWTGDEEGTPESLEVPTMRNLYDKITALFESKDYVGEVKSNLKTALEVRIGSLLRRGVGAMLNTQRSSPSVADLLKYPTILELDYLNQDQANLMTFFLLTKIREYIKRTRTEDVGLPEHVILLEEAHNLVARNLGITSAEEANTRQEASNFITRMLAEMRALREAIIIADQLPTAVAAEVVKNTNIKIAHRLVSADDRKDIGQAMLLDQSQMEEIARLETGEFFLYMEGWYRPHQIKIPSEKSAKKKLGMEKSLTNSELSQRIQPQFWYRQGQETLLNTAIAEHEFLCKEYQKTLSQLRADFEQVNEQCSKLNQLFKEIREEVFHRLVGELKFQLKPTSEASLLEVEAGKVDSRQWSNLKPSQHLSLEELLNLRLLLANRLAVLDVQWETVNTSYQRISRSKVKQIWQQLNRQIKVLQQRILYLSSVLGEINSSSIQQRWQELLFEQEQLIFREEPKLLEVLKELEEGKRLLQQKIAQVLDAAIAQAKISKVINDFKEGG